MWAEHLEEWMGTMGLFCGFGHEIVGLCRTTSDALSHHILVLKFESYETYE